MAKLSDVPILPVPLTRAEWEMLPHYARETCKTLFLDHVGIETYDDWQDYKAKNSFPNLPTVNVPMSPGVPYQPFRARYPGLNLGYPAGIALDASGNVRTVSIVARTDGAANIGNVETQVQPGGTDAPSLTLQALGGAQAAGFFAEYGGYFPNGQIPAIGWLPYTPDSLISANFDGSSFNQLPLAWSSAGAPGGMDWLREWYPAPGSMFGSPFKVVLFKYADFTRLIPKFGAPASTPSNAIVYANDGNKTAAVITALQAAGLGGQVLGDAVNAAARKTV